MAVSPLARSETGFFEHNGVLDGLSSGGDWKWSDGPEDAKWVEAKGYVLVQDPGNQFGMGQDFTVEGWVNLDSADHPMVLFSKGYSNWDVSIAEGGELEVVTFCNAVPTGVKVPLHQWTHIAVSIGEAPDLSPVEVFVNGTSVYHGKVTADPSCPVDEGHPFTIGAELPLTTDLKAFGLTGAFGVEGRMDEVRFWTTNRLAEEVARDRFVTVGDAPKANDANALGSALEYANLIASWNFSYPTFAYDFIGHHDGEFMGSATATEVDTTPIPYNQVLAMTGGPGDYVVVPNDGAAFNQSEGTIELWLQASRWQRAVLLSRGESFRLSLTASGGLDFLMGAAQVSAPLATVALDEWNHVAATWRIAKARPGDVPQYELSILVNGRVVAKKVAQTGFPVSNSDLWIGQGPAVSTAPFEGLMDEVRYWSGARTEADVQRMMFASGRGQLDPQNHPVAMWSFEGNLYDHLNYAHDGTFDTGRLNRCRFSAYADEGQTGSFGPSFHAYPTVINRTRIPGNNDFPSKFVVRAPFAPIPVMASVKDTLTLPSNAGKGTRIEVLLAVRHPAVADLTCSLSHAGVIYELFGYGASAGSDVLSFFSSDLGKGPDDASVPAPWGFVGPADELGPFTAAFDAAGDWTLSCTSNGWDGVLNGWALRVE